MTTIGKYDHLRTSRRATTEDSGGCDCENRDNDYGEENNNIEGFREQFEQQANRAAEDALGQYLWPRVVCYRSSTHLSSAITTPSTQSKLN